MTNFDQALAFTLKWEGGYVSDPDDPGGATNMGITQGTYNRWNKLKGLPMQAVRSMPRSVVAMIYKTLYWMPAGCEKCGLKTSMVLFDIAVNHGVGRARQWYALVKKDLPDITQARILIDRRVNFYYDLVKRKPTLRKFLNGWLARVRSLKKEVGY